MHPRSSWTVRITMGLLLLAAGTACRRGPDDPLIAAAREGDVKHLEALLAAGADPNRPDGRFTGWTPLQHAVHKRQLEAAPLLRVPSSGAGRLSRWLGAGRGCDEVRQMFARR